MLVIRVRELTVLHLQHISDQTNMPHNALLPYAGHYSSSKSTLWDPYDLLEIRPGLCSGVTLRGTPCGQRVNAGDTNTAHKILYELTLRDPRNVPVDMLEDLAEVTLCRQWHRFRKPQGPEVVAFWSAVIRRYVRTMVPPVEPPSTSSRRSTASRQWRIRSQSIDEADYRSSSTSASVLQPAISTSTRSMASSSRGPATAAPRSNLPEARSHREYTTHSRPTPLPTIPAITASSGSPRSSVTSDNPPTPPPTTATSTPSFRSRSPSVTSNSPTRTNITRPVTPDPEPASPVSATAPSSDEDQTEPHITQTPAAPPSPYVPRRQSLTDCLICHESFESSEGPLHIVHCRAQCGHNFHNECMQPWVEHLRDVARTTGRQRAPLNCPYCRSRWAWTDEEKNLL